MSFSVHFSFSTLFRVFYCHIPGQTMFVSHFSRFSFFSPYSRSYSAHFSFSTFFSVSCYIPCQTVFVSHFSHYFFLTSGFFLIFHVFIIFFAIIPVLECVFSPLFSFSHVLQCVFFIFQNCQFLAIFQVLQYAFFSP